MTTLPSTVTPIVVVSADPEHAACTPPSAADASIAIGLMPAALSGWCCVRMDTRELPTTYPDGLSGDRTRHRAGRMGPP